MPKIKLSALVSDMKGKANGSVFSSNSGGVYFRNNPSGGGRKSSKWAKQKQQFTSVASSFKSLDYDQQEAWNLAAPSFPTIGAFGDARITSGYELYMRINGARQAAGLPLLLTPVTPQEFPTLSNFEVNYPEEWQFTPFQGFNCFSNDVATSNPYVACDALWTTSPTFVGRALSTRMIYSGGLNAFIANGEAVNIFLLTNGSTISTTLTLTEIDGDDLKIQLQTTDNSGDVISTYSVSKTLLNSPMHFVMPLNPFGYSAPDIYVNGAAVSGTAVATGTFGDASTSPKFALFPQKVDAKQKIIASDFRYYDRMLTVDEISLIYNGYVLEDEVALLGLNDVTAEEVTNYTSNDPALEFYVFDFDSSIDLIGDFNQVLVPMFSIDFDTLTAPDFVMAVYASPSVSRGITGAYSNIKLLGYFDVDGVSSIDVQQAYADVYQNCSPNSQVIFETKLLDTTSGVQNRKNDKPKKKKVRFKAGSDLQTKVN